MPRFIGRSTRPVPLEVSRKLNTLIRQLPFFVGLGGAYAMARSIAHLDQGPRFAIASATVLLLGYVFVWFNIWVMRRAGQAARFAAPRPALVGHLLMFAGAGLMGYGFAALSNVMLIAGFAFLWFADDRLISVDANPWVRNSAK
jgi:hypothetical protein